MPSVVVVGGSVVGSVTALLLARAGWQVTVVDHEAARAAAGGPPTVRPGAPHTVQAHGFMARTLHELTTRLPDVAAALHEAGVPRLSLEELVPPHLYDGGRADDAELATLRVRRVTLDRVVVGAARAEPGTTHVEERVVGLVADPGDPPRVRGVAVGTGQRLTADLVVDAAGRRSPVAGWLADLGAAPPERTDPSGARYYTRHYRVRDGARPPLNRGFAEVHAFPSLDQLLFLGDGASAMLAQSVHDDDEVLKALRHPEAFDAVAAANPDLAAWWSVLEPASEVFCLGRFPNRLRSPVRDGRPVVRGLVQVGDALAATNPTRGRGISMGLSAAGRLVDALAEHGPGDEAVLALGAWVERSLAVYYRETAAADEATTRRLRAGLRGRSVPGNAPSVELPADHPFDSGDLDRAAGSDPDLLRVLLRATMLLDDDRRVASAEVAEQVRRAQGSAPASVGGASPPRSGGLHDRAVVEELLAAYA